MNKTIAILLVIVVAIILISVFLLTQGKGGKPSGSDGTGQTHNPPLDSLGNDQGLVTPPSQSETPIGARIFTNCEDLLPKTSIETLGKNVTKYESHITPQSALEVPSIVVNICTFVFDQNIIGNGLIAGDFTVYSDPSLFDRTVATGDYITNNQVGTKSAYMKPLFGETAVRTKTHIFVSSSGKYYVTLALQSLPAMTGDELFNKTTALAKEMDKYL